MFVPTFVGQQHQIPSRTYKCSVKFVSIYNGKLASKLNQNVKARARELTKNDCVHISRWPDVQLHLLLLFRVDTMFLCIFFCDVLRFMRCLQYFTSLLFVDSFFVYFIQVVGNRITRIEKNIKTIFEHMQVYVRVRMYIGQCMCLIILYFPVNKAIQVRHTHANR